MKIKGFLTKYGNSSKRVIIKNLLKDKDDMLQSIAIIINNGTKNRSSIIITQSMFDTGNQGMIIDTEQIYQEIYFDINNMESVEIGFGENGLSFDNRKPTKEGQTRRNTNPSDVYLTLKLKPTDSIEINRYYEDGNKYQLLDQKSYII